MAIQTVDWLLPERVLYVRMWGDVALDELQAHNLRMLDLLNASPIPLYLFLDARERGSIPRNLNTLRRAVEYTGHKNLAGLLHVSTNSTVNAVSEILSKVLRAKYRQFQTFEEATDYLKRLNPDLDWANANWSLLPRSDTEA